MELAVTTDFIAFAGVFLICFMKGAFGGGFSIIGIPLLSIVMDPVTAGGLLAPLFIAMDLFALRYWKPSTWSKPEPHSARRSSGRYWRRCQGLSDFSAPGGARVSRFGVET